MDYKNDENSIETTHALNKEPVSVPNGDATMAAKEGYEILKKKKTLSAKQVSPEDILTLKGLRARLEGLEMKSQEDASTIRGLHTRISELQVSSKVLEFEKIGLERKCVELAEKIKNFEVDVENFLNPAKTTVFFHWYLLLFLLIAAVVSLYLAGAALDSFFINKMNTIDQVAPFITEVLQKETLKGFLEECAKENWCRSSFDDTFWKLVKSQAMKK